MRRLLLILCPLLLAAGEPNDPDDLREDAPPPRAAPAEAPKAEAPPAAPAPTPAAEPAPREWLDEGIEAFHDKDARAAAPLLFHYLAGTPPTDEGYAWGQLFLARSLAQLGLRHAAAVYLAKIARERTNPEVLPQALEDLRALSAYPHDETLVDERVFGTLDVGFLPDGVSGYAHLQQGLLDLRMGYDRWSKSHLGAIPQGTAEEARARFATLVDGLKDAKALPPKTLAGFAALADEQKLPLELRNEALLAVARLQYEQGDFAGALKSYQRVSLPPLDAGRATLYLEEAWARYQLGELHVALGLLTTLDAPPFRGEFIPDKYLLRAFIYRDLCHYLPAKRAAKELFRRYADSLDAVRSHADLLEDPGLTRAANGHGATRRADAFRRLLELESEGLSERAGIFGDALYGYLKRLYTQALAEAGRLHRLALSQAVEEEADGLLKAAEQARLLNYEVGLQLYERIKKGGHRASPLDEDVLGDRQLAFWFNGEYWSDELRLYKVQLASRCVEGGGR